MEIKTGFFTIGEIDNPIPALLDTLNSYDENNEISNTVTDEQKWDLIRKLRDELLSQSDWVVIKAYESGVPMSEGWAIYRQALRDLPQNFGTPEEVILPEMPN